MADTVYVHPTAEVTAGAVIGEGTRIWHYAQIREGAALGSECIVGKGAYVDAGVTIGDRVKIQNGCQVYHGATVMDGAFLGPGVILTNDRYPRAINPDGSLKRADDWIVGQIVIKQGASVGAGAIVVPPVTVGAFSIVGAGSVVTRDVPPHGLVAGNPARLVGFVCACGQRLKKGETDAEIMQAVCTGCGQVTPVPVSSWRLLK